MSSFCALCPAHAKKSLLWPVYEILKVTLFRECHQVEGDENWLAVDRTFFARSLHTLEHKSYGTHLKLGLPVCLSFYDVIKCTGYVIVVWMRRYFFNDKQHRIFGIDKIDKFLETAPIQRSQNAQLVLYRFYQNYEFRQCTEINRCTEFRQSPEFRQSTENCQFSENCQCIEAYPFSKKLQIGPFSTRLIK